MSRDRLIQWLLSAVTITRLGLFFMGSAALRADEPPTVHQAPPRLPQLPDAETAMKSMTNAPIKMVSPGVFEIGKVKLNRNDNSVSFPAVVNLDHGAMEYFLVSPYGPTHESVLRTDAKPFHIHLAMLLLGARASTTNAGPASSGSAFISNPGKEILPGDKISLDVSWQVDGKEFHRPAEELIFNQATKSVAARGIWVYNGSLIAGGNFQAQALGTIASLVTDRDTLINNVGVGHDNDKIWTVNSNTLPPFNAPVRVTIKLESSPPK